MRGALTLLLALSLTLSACGPNLDDYSASASSALGSFMSAFNIAGQTPRMSLTAPIMEMDGARQDWNSLTPPKCAKEGHAIVSDALNGYVQAYLAFQGQESDTAVNRLFETADSSFGLGQQMIIDSCNLDDWSVWE